MLVCVPSAYALSIAVYPYQIELGDGYVFHGTPWSVDEEPGANRFRGFIVKNGEFISIPEGEEMDFPISGLYKDGELVYASNYFINPPFFSQDAMSFLVLNPEWHEQAAIRFYQQGILKYEHNLRDLLIEVDPLLVLDTSLIFHMDEFIRPRWEVFDLREYDRANNALQITTISGSEIAFDLSTGQVSGMTWSDQRMLTEFCRMMTAVTLVGISLLILILRCKCCQACVRKILRNP